jgi:hypothetical protein
MLNLTVRGAVPPISPRAASGVDLKTASGGWFPGGGVGGGAAFATTVVEHEADCRVVFTVKVAVKVPEAA